MSRNVRLTVRPLDEREIPDEVDDSVLAKTFLELSYNLDSEFAVGGWGQAPVLLLLRLRRDRTGARRRRRGHAAAPPLSSR